MSNGDTPASHPEPGTASPADVFLLAKQQLGPIADVFMRAFVDYPLLRHAVPDDKKRPRATRALYASVLAYTRRYGQTFTTSTLTGAAGWLPPERPFPRFLRMVRVGMLALPFRLGWSGFQRLQAVDHVAEERHHFHAPGPHWYLWVVAVDPPCQGRGVAGRLMRPVLDRADHDRLPCYLETHQETNVRIYERYGFEVASRTPVPGQPLRVWAMLRSPGAVAPRP